MYCSPGDGRFHKNERQEVGSPYDGNQLPNQLISRQLAAPALPPR
jgi:hypothetical protein